jgi:hypothetical protein
VGLTSRSPIKILESLGFKCCFEVLEADLYMFVKLRAANAQHMIPATVLCIDFVCFQGLFPYDGALGTLI